jgi:nucleotide-binding universal stress UspA family protein
MSAPQSIIVGFDGSEDSKAALRWAALLSGAMGARLRIVHAVGLLEHAGLSDHAVARRETALQVVTDAGVRSADVEWTVVDGDPCSALLRMTIAPESADLIVVGSRGSDAHAGSLLGSTSLELARHAAVPVLIVPAERQIGDTAPV